MNVDRGSLATNISSRTQARALSESALARHLARIVRCGMSQLRNLSGGDIGDLTGNDEQKPTIVLPTGELLPPHGGRLKRPWRKGQSGNPDGRNTVTAYHKARAICAAATEEAARRQVELMSDSDTRVAFMATEAVLRRGAGVPRDHSAEDQAASRIDLSGLSHEDQAALAQLLQRALGLTR